MNWYFNNTGAAEGPMDDNAMAQLARDNKLASDSLVWHAGLEAWQTIAALSPAWWAASLPTPVERNAPAEEQKTAKIKLDNSNHRLSGVHAPNSESDEKKESGGWLLRCGGGLVLRGRLCVHGAGILGRCSRRQLGGTGGSQCGGLWHEFLYRWLVEHRQCAAFNGPGPGHRGYPARTDRAGQLQ
ncbi:MAG: DUF4339 domain-containing protein [Verrucomicrobiota bacterium]|nr:DUF4339 domain-containing protein [Verrucomicrobiota bacterium]